MTTRTAKILRHRLADLRFEMDLLALRTWTNYRDGHPMGLTPGEESATDANLLDLHRKVPALAVRRLTKPAEKTIGADWEWFIGSPDERWLCLRIQAKRINKTGYPALNHEGFDDDDYQYAHSSSPATSRTCFRTTCSTTAGKRAVSGRPTTSMP